MKVTHENLGTVNRNKVTLEHEGRQVTMYFSYATLMAVHAQMGMLVRENTWGVTTERLVGGLQPNKELRQPGELIEAYGKEALEWLIIGNGVK